MIESPNLGKIIIPCKRGDDGGWHRIVWPFDYFLEDRPVFHVVNIEVNKKGEIVMPKKLIAEIKRSEMKAGKSAKKADDIAYATANKRGLLHGKKHKGKK